MTDHSPDCDTQDVNPEGIRKPCNCPAGQSLAPATGSGAVPCAFCGCLGNMDCGHAPLDAKRCCTLDGAEVCPCCRAKAERPNTQRSDGDVK